MVQDKYKYKHRGHRFSDMNERLTFHSPPYLPTHLLTGTREEEGEEYLRKDKEDVSEHQGHDRIGN